MREFFEKLNKDDPFHDLVNRVMYVGGLALWTGLIVGLVALVECGKSGKGSPKQDITPVKPDTTFVINQDTIFYAKQNQHVR